MNKTELARKIQALEGLDNEEKTALLDLLRRNKKYGLVWEEKPEDIEDRLRDELPVLIERNDDKVHSIISDNPEAPNHLIIEGDNLAALTELSYTHAGKIDVIYIDPPYNTGNKDFKYNDSYVDKIDAFRHSKWLSFITKRLLIAKTLLHQKGIIFISIDENEYAALKLLCDEIFGRNNLVASFIWKSKSGGANDARFVATDSEYILAYAQNVDSLELSDDEGRTVTTTYNREDENGRYSLDRLDKQSLGYHASLDFPIIGPDGIEYTVHHVDPEHKVARWRWSKDTVEERYDELVFENGCVYTKNYESEGAMPRNILFEERFGRTRSGKTELFSIIGPNDFDNPKPSKLISYLLSLFPNKNCVVLDFFAGSGTTLNAIMRSNFIDGGKRLGILVTNNENQICETVTYPRNKNIIVGYNSKGKNNVVLFSEKITITKLKKATSILNKIEDLKKIHKQDFDSFKVEIKDGFITLLGILDKSEEVDGLSDNNLRYYRTEFLPRERSVKNMRELVQAATGLLCIKNDNYTEAPFGGRKMNSKYARFFDNGKEKMLIIYEERAIPFIADIIKTMPEDTKIMVYVFSHGSYAYNDEFSEVADRVELCALPQAIYDAYQKVLPKRKPKFLPDELVEEIIENEITENQGLFSFDNETEKGGEA